MRTSRFAQSCTGREISKQGVNENILILSWDTPSVATYVGSEAPCLGAPLALSVFKWVTLCKLTLFFSHRYSGNNYSTSLTKLSRGSSEIIFITHIWQVIHKMLLLWSRMDITCLSYRVSRGGNKSHFIENFSIKPSDFGAGPLSLPHLTGPGQEPGKLCCLLLPGP